MLIFFWKLIDQDKSFKIFAESFLSASYFTKTNIQYQLYDLKTVKAFSGHDLICMSYSLNELTDENAQHIVHQAWLATKKALVIIEPGTPRAFQNLKKRRAELINYGARILAPCPHTVPAGLPKVFSTPQALVVNPRKLF